MPDPWPVRVCLLCEEPIRTRDMAEVTVHNGERRWSHLECVGRRTFGSLGHQLGLCKCNGGPGTLDDPPGMSKRKAAQVATAVFAVLNRKGSGRRARVCSVCGPKCIHDAPKP